MLVDFHRQSKRKVSICEKMIKWGAGGSLQIGRTDATETVILLWKYSGVCHSNEHSENIAGNVNSELQT